MLAVAASRTCALQWPERTRTYRNYILDSRNWDRVTLRPDDIVISTSYKSGTTWMQNIVLRLVFLGQPLPAVSDTSYWVDRARPDPEALATTLAAQTHRRILKSHLPLDGLPYDPAVRYIVVVRDARDVFMSFWNHYSGFNDAVYTAVNDPARLVGPPMPRCPADIHALWAVWINRGWFPWETEGYPHSGNLHHTRTWWAHRRLDNILFVHFNDLLCDPATEIGVIAEHLGITVTPENCATIAADTTFDAFKRNPGPAGLMAEDAARTVWKDGLHTFFNKGTNGRWKGVLTRAELQMYEAAKVRVLTPACAAYTERGRSALW